VFAETCPQCLFLTAEDLGIDDSYQGARCTCSPPPRDKSNQQVIWNGLADGLFTVFSSDHAPFRYDAPEGKKPDGEEVAFRHIPNGIPGIETRVALMYSEGVLGGRMTANRFVELTATQSAKAYGLHPRKGASAAAAMPTWWCGTNARWCCTTTCCTTRWTTRLMLAWPCEPDRGSR